MKAIKLPVKDDQVYYACCDHSVVTMCSERRRKEHYHFASSIGSERAGIEQNSA